MKSKTYPSRGEGGVVDPFEGGIGLEHCHPNPANLCLFSELARPSEKHEPPQQYGQLFCAKQELSTHNCLWLRGATPEDWGNAMAPREPRPLINKSA
jgi:hypothetical protein